MCGGLCQSAAWSQRRAFTNARERFDFFFLRFARRDDTSDAKSGISVKIK